MAPKKKDSKRNDEKEGGDADISEVDQRKKDLADLFKSANKNFGANTLYIASEHQFKDKKVIPTGILPLDYALGGGVPVGRIAMWYGHRSTAKTTNLLRIIGNAQKLCSDCYTEIVLKSPDSDKKSCNCGINRKMMIVWLDVEGAWEDKWASNFVTMDDSLIISQPKTAEETIDLAFAALKMQVDIIVIDSIAFMIANAELEKSASEVTMGLQAKLMGNAMRRFVSALNSEGREKGRRPTVLMTNQMRQKIGVMFGSPDTISGGLAAGFATSVEVKTSMGKYEMDEVSGKPMLVENSARIEKNKMGPPRMEATWKVQLLQSDLKKVGDIIDEHWAFDMGEKAGLISVAPQKIEWDGKTYRGRSQLEKYWMENRADYKRFQDELMPIILAV